MTWPIVFWTGLALVAYAYAGYPLLTSALARFFGRAPRRDQATPAITVVVAAHNESARIGERVRDILAQDYPADRLRVLVVSDGSTDDTARQADVGDPRVRVLELPRNGGKAVALNQALAQVDTPLVAFTDARQHYAAGAVRQLVSAFADPDVGAVSGELVILPGAGAAADTGLYWRMEKRLRHDEALLSWLHGVTGAVYALRRELYAPMPPGTILDDMWVPLHAVQSGRRVWMARDAIAYDVSSADAGEEFRRKLRTLAGNWQLLARMPRLLNPFRNRIFFALLSHKWLRLLAPWALLATWLASALANGTFYRAMFLLQCLAYAAAAAALAWPRPAKRVPLLPTAGTFVMLNLAALLSLPAAFIDTRHLWKKH
ncbi:MAG: glycosyltransferase family 2 protein [Pseudoxanthomonas sp.]